MSALVPLLISALAAAAAAPASFRGLEPVEARLDRPLDHAAAGRPDRKALRSCLVHARHAVLWSDEGELGAADVELRARPEGMSAEAACADAFEGTRVSVRPGDRDALDPVGLVDGYLVARYPDTFGSLGTFFLFDLATGEKAFEARFATGPGVAFAREDGQLQATFWSALPPVDCVPRGAGSWCWDRIRRLNRVPQTVPPPDCGRALSQLRAENPGTVLLRPERLQMAVQVRVGSFPRAKVAWLNGVPACGLAP